MCLRARQILDQACEIGLVSAMVRIAHMGVSTIGGTPITGLFIMENRSIHGFGGPPFQETSIWVVLGSNQQKTSDLIGRLRDLT